MKSNDMFYYLSLGSNIQPESNAAKMIRHLAEKFGPLVAYPFVYTKPENIHTDKAFLNSLAIICSPLTLGQIKDELNTIEEILGRDRADPQRSLKDRTADIDILGKTDRLDMEFFSHYKESYISGIVNICDSSSIYMLPALTATKRPTTIDFDSTSGDIRVLNHRDRRLKDWHKPSLERQ